MSWLQKYLIGGIPNKTSRWTPSTSNNAEDLIRLSIAIKEDQETLQAEFKSFYNNILKEGTRENKALIDRY